MARESQGLQIALIVFVMLTIIFMVMSFVFFRSYNDALAKADASVAEKNKADQERNQANEKATNLLQFIGWGATEPMENVQREFAKDMESHLQSIPAAERSYRKAAATLSKSLQDTGDKLALAQNQVKTLEGTLKDREKAADQKFQQALAAQQTAEKDVMGERDKFNQSSETLRSKNTQLVGQVSDTKKKAEEAVVSAEAQKDAAAKEVQKLGAVLRGEKDKLNAMTREDFETPSGRIEWVNQRARTLWINLGESDYLGRLTTFSVYDKDAVNIARAEKKGSIEVVQLLGPHLAEARITEEKSLGNPILPGDLIHTPIWQPGRPKHFVLAGNIDIDNNGVSDLKTVLSLIQMNGGVVDWYMDEKGNPSAALDTALTSNTNYIVMGKEPPETDATKSLELYNDVMRLAQRYAIKRVGLREFLAQVGYKPEERVIRFGTGTSQMPLQAKEGAQRVSTGNVSPTYKERKPPAKTGAAP